MSSLFLQDGRLKCKKCKFDIPLEKLPKGFDPLKILHNCNNPKNKSDSFVVKKYDRHKRPNIIKKGITFAKATAKHLKSGKKPTEEKLHNLRLEVCDLCKHGDNQECFICGCKIPTKASWAGESCPLKKWPNNMKDLIFRNKQPGNLRDCYLNAGCFFVGCGPSVGNLDLNLLKERGILSFGVNNVAAYYNVRPNFWCSTDNPESFHEVIWRDPGIIKFIRDENAKELKWECVNLYTFQVNEDFDATTFFQEPTINWGCESSLVDEYGNKGRRSVMFCALRLMFYLGIRRVYLAGCDFKMKEDKPYVFDQHKWKGGVKTNNDGYKAMNERFTHLNEIAVKLNYKIYNVSPGSELTAFPRMSYEEAIEKERLETPKSLSGMYGESKNG